MRRSVAESQAALVRERFIAHRKAEGIGFSRSAEKCQIADKLRSVLEAWIWQRPQCASRAECLYARHPSDGRRVIAGVRYDIHFRA